MEPGESEKPRTIAAALVAAQRAAQSVPKDGENKFHNYRYVTAEALMAEARAALNSAGLATTMESWSMLPPTHDLAPDRVKVCFTTYHELSDGRILGEVEYFVIPEKGRPMDKAVATALTHAEGYYLRGLLCLPRVDASEDVDQRDDRAKEPPPPRPVVVKPPIEKPAAVSSVDDEPGEEEMGTLAQSRFFHAQRTRLGWTEEDARAWFATQPGAEGRVYLSETPKKVVTRILDAMKQLADVDEQKRGR